MPGLLVTCPHIVSIVRNNHLGLLAPYWSTCCGKCSNIDSPVKNVPILTHLWSMIQYWLTCEVCTYIDSPVKYVPILTHLWRMYPYWVTREIMYQYWVTCEYIYTYWVTNLIIVPMLWFTCEVCSIVDSPVYYVPISSHSWIYIYIYWVSCE
jgi:hypothetical protein